MKSFCFKDSSGQSKHLSRTALTGPSPLGQDAAVATRIADIRRACEINGWPDDCIADPSANSLRLRQWLLSEDWPNPVCPRSTRPAAQSVSCMFVCQSPFNQPLNLAPVGATDSQADRAKALFLLAARFALRVLMKKTEWFNNSPLTHESVTFR